MNASHRSEHTLPSLSIRGRVASVCLRNPQAINALGPEDVDVLDRLLRQAVAHPEVDVVVIRSEVPRGFSAGGDIKHVGHLIAAGRRQELARFWSAEFRLDHLVATCPKPVVTVAHGLTLGGGLGLTAHARHRVVATSAEVAMPETLIGLAPDVGMHFLLARAPGRSGCFAAACSARLSAGDAVHMGLADVVVDDTDVPTMLAALEQGTPPAEALREVSRPARSWVAEHQAALDTLFGPEDPTDVVTGLRGGLASGDGATREVAEVALPSLAEVSPTAFAVTLECLRRASRMREVSECFQQDLHVGLRFAGHPDLAEGIRARVVRKDRAPRWQPGSISAVDRSAVLAFFDGPPDVTARYEAPRW